MSRRGSKPVLAAKASPTSSGISAAAIVGRSPAAARQLASRARRRVQQAATVPTPDLTRQRQVVDAFLAASRNGDFDALLAMLDPDVVLRPTGQPCRWAHRGRSTVRRPWPTPSPGAPGPLNRHWSTEPPAPCGALGGQPRVVFAFTITPGKIVEIELVADAERLRRLELAMVED